MFHKMLPTIAEMFAIVNMPKLYRVRTSNTGRQKWYIIERRAIGASKFSGRPILFFFIKENWIWAMTKRHDEPNINP